MKGVLWQLLQANKHKKNNRNLHQQNRAEMQKSVVTSATMVAYHEMCAMQDLLWTWGVDKAVTPCLHHAVASLPLSDIPNGNVAVKGFDKKLAKGDKHISNVPRHTKTARSLSYNHLTLSTHEHQMQRAFLKPPQAASCT